MSHLPELWKLLNWKDPTVYRWCLNPTLRRNGLVIVPLLLVIGLFWGGAYFALWVVSFLSTTLAFWLALSGAGVLLLLYIISCVVSFWAALTGTFQDQAHHYRHRGQAVAICAMGVFWFALTGPGSPIASGFRGSEQAGFFGWMLFGIDQVLSVGTFDLVEVVQFKVSAVQPVSWEARWGVMLLRVLIAVMLLELFFGWLRSYLYPLLFYGTVKESYWKCKGFHMSPNAPLVILGRVVPLASPISTWAGALVESFDESVQPVRYGPTKKALAGGRVDANLLTCWNDPKIYQWATHHPERAIGFAFGLLTGVFLAPVLIYLFLLLVSWLSPAIAFWLAVLFGSYHLFAYCCHRFSLFAAAVTTQYHERIEEFRVRGQAMSFWALTCLWFAISGPGSPLQVGFQGSDRVSFLGWQVYGLENLLGVLTLDLPALAQWQLTAVTPDGTLARFSVWLLRVLLVATVIEYISAWVRANFFSGYFFGTFKECYWRCKGFASNYGARLVLEAEVQPFQPPGTISAADWVQMFDLEADLEWEGGVDAVPDTSEALRFFFNQLGPSEKGEEKNDQREQGPQQS